MREGVECFEVSYIDWFSNKAVVEYNSQCIEIVPKNFWKSKFDIYKNDVDCGDIIFNWMGHVIIRLSRLDGAPDDEFLLKHRGLISTEYDLITINNERVLTLKANYDWSKLKYFYSIEKENHGFLDEVLDEFLIYCGFAANLHMTHLGMG